MIPRYRSGCFTSYRNIWNEVESQLCKKLATEPIKGKDKYMHGKLNMWKGHIKKSFLGQDVPQDMRCNAKAMLKVDSLYKQGKNCHPQVYAEECKYTDAESQQWNMLSVSDDDVYEGQKEG